MREVFNNSVLVNTSELELRMILSKSMEFIRLDKKVLHIEKMDKNQYEIIFMQRAKIKKAKVSIYENKDKIIYEIFFEKFSLELIWSIEPLSQSQTIISQNISVSNNRNSLYVFAKLILKREFRKGLLGIKNIAEIKN